MSSVPDYVVRLMKKEDIPQVLDIWRETGLQEGTKCVDTWFEVDPEGFYVAATDSDEVLGVCCAVAHHEDMAFVGIYAVREKYRGHGIGVKLWKACYKHIGEGNGAVNAIPGKMELYRDRGGFPIEETEWLSISCETDKDVDPGCLLDEVDGVEVRPLTDDELPLALEYDKALIGYSREKIITLTVHEDDSVSFIALKDGKCVGYGTIKISIQGHGQVGPLYADNQEIAEVLLRRLIEGLPQAKGLALMIVSTNEGAQSIVGKTGMVGTEECPRLYKKYKFDVDKSKVFGQIDLNFSPY